MYDFPLFHFAKVQKIIIFAKTLTHK